MHLSTPLITAMLALTVSAAANCSENTCLLRLRGALFIRNTSVGSFCRKFAKDRQHYGQFLTVGDPCNETPGLDYENVAAACACAEEARVKYPALLVPGINGESQGSYGLEQRILG